MKIKIDWGILKYRERASIRYLGWGRSSPESGERRETVQREWRFPATCSDPRRLGGRRRSWWRRVVVWWPSDASQVARMNRQLQFARRRNRRGRREEGEGKEKGREEKRKEEGAWWKWWWRWVGQMKKMKFRGWGTNTERFHAKMVSVFAVLFFFFFNNSALFVCFCFCFL